MVFLLVCQGSGSSKVSAGITTALQPGCDRSNRVELQVAPQLNDDAYLLLAGTDNA